MRPLPRLSPNVTQHHTPHDCLTDFVLFVISFTDVPLSVLLLDQRIPLSKLVFTQVRIELGLAMAVVFLLLTIPRRFRMWLTVPDSSLAKLIRLIHHPTSLVIGLPLPNCLPNDAGTVVRAKLVTGVAWESFRLLHNS